MNFLLSAVVLFTGFFALANEAVQFKVQTYNVKGLPPLAAPGWGNERFAFIAQDLNTKLQNNQAPDVVMLQEVFTKEAVNLIALSGYPYSSQGPTRNGEDANGPYQKIYSSGIFILSKYPILEAGFITYGKEICATYDCHANKGAQYIKFNVPGIEAPVTVFNTHMQSGSKFDDVRLQQAPVLTQFVQKHFSNDGLLFVAGDFNTKPVFESFFLIKNTLELTSAGETCLTPRSGCEVLNNTNPEELLTDTVDHIFYSTPATYEIKVLTAQRNFTETFNNKPLSDHLGYEAVFSINKK